MKSKKKLKTIKEKIETEKRWYRLLTDEELEQVSGGKEQTVDFYTSQESEVIVLGDDVPDGIK